MRSLVVLSLIGYIAGTALATCDTSCPKYTIPTCATGSGNTCIAPSSGLRVRRSPASHLFRRTCGDCPPTECPTDSKKCTPGGQQPPQVTPKTVTLDCGQKPTQFSVTSTYVNCPSDSTKKCLVFQLSGEGLEQPKLDISFGKLTQSAPGQFRYNTYCTASTCTVPIDDILTKEGKTLNDLCNLPLWIGFHSGYGGDTCWAQGEPINSNGNWAMQFSLSFECPTLPPTCCCCAPAPSQPDKKCGSETAYASGSNTFNLDDLKCTKAWGYYQKYGKDVVGSIAVGDVVYTANLLAGKTNDVGDVTVTKTSATCFKVALNAAPKYGVGLAHIDISCKDPDANLGKFCRTPGKYDFNSGCLATDPSTGWEVCAEAECAHSYYFIIHAETYSVVSADAGDAYENCDPYKC